MHKMERIYVVNRFENMKFIRAEMNISQKYLAVRFFSHILFGAFRIHSLDFIDVALFRFSKICSLAPNAMHKKNRSDRIIPHVKTTTTTNNNNKKCKPHIDYGKRIQNSPTAKQRYAMSTVAQHHSFVCTTILQQLFRSMFLFFLLLLFAFPLAIAFLHCFMPWTILLYQVPYKRIKSFGYQWIYARRDAHFFWPPLTYCHYYSSV